MKKNLFLLLGFCCFTMMSFTINDIIDYLSTGTELSFNSEKYDLAWSSHPNATYFKQEYLRKSDKLEKYEKMMMVEAIKTTLNPENVSQMKINELTNIKKLNPIVNFKQAQVSNQNDKILSFTISGGNILEWNVYRYKKIADSKGNPTVLLFALSKRAYGKDITPFLTDLKSTRIGLINLVWDYKLPTINFKD